MVAFSSTLKQTPEGKSTGIKAVRPMPGELPIIILIKKQTMKDYTSPRFIIVISPLRSLAFARFKDCTAPPQEWMM